MRFYGRQHFTHVTIQLLEELSTSYGTLLAEVSGSLCLVPPRPRLCTLHLLLCSSASNTFAGVNCSHEYSDVLSPLSPPSISSNQGCRARGFGDPTHEAVPEDVHWQP
ncbi:unnamed protein product [Rangifer tarandus platyrhynchus]|uniref:Uncharacterized protein n=2 Tax=Rangifer tarandus platyrhynchus TaxID=3082113 RepID=A0ABN8ZX52_RANTA|nr:unnamed protein product [Rangifer tarandus platyrhynchus]